MSEGDAVSIVFYNGDTPTVLPGTIVAASQPVVEVGATDATSVNVGQTVKLIQQVDEVFWESPAEIVSCEDSTGRWLVTTKELQWRRTDGRKHPRFPLEVPVKLVVIQRCGATTVRIDFDGASHDLSLGGAAVSVEGDLQVGWLVEFQATLKDSATVRALAIVARRESGSGRLGIEFVDYIGGSRYLMHSYLCEAA